MSEEERLKRLGLEHLKDKPEELEKEIRRRLSERADLEKEWEELREKKIKEQEKKDPPDSK